MTLALTMPGFQMPGVTESETCHGMKNGEASFNL